MTWRVVVADRVAESGLKLLAATSDIEVLAMAGKPKEDLDRALAGAHALIVRSETRVTADVLARAPLLRVVARAGTGVDTIDVPAATRRGIAVMNAPGANTVSAGEHALGLLLALVRRIPEAAAAMRGGGWDRKKFEGTELRGKTMGVVGLGRIGAHVAQLARAFGMSVVAHDPYLLPERAAEMGVPLLSLEDLLRTADVVTLHVALTDQTHHLINAERLRLMKNGAILLNFARDGIVDEDAVVEALAAKRIRYYVCDFPTKKLQGHPHVIALPHLGASTGEAEDNSAVMVVDEVRDYLEHGNLQNAVNFPDAQMPREAPYRLAISNANVPDMLGRISHTLGKRKINIHNMLNKSKGEMAYTLVDTDTAVRSEVIDELCKTAGVLAVRYLPVDG